MTMDIKARIDGLSEAEAKAALEACIAIIVRYTHCEDCWNAELADGRRVACGSERMCAEYWANEALKEARHEHKNED